MRPFDQLMELFKKSEPEEPETPVVEPVSTEGSNRGGPSEGGGHKASRKARLNSGQHRSQRW